MSIIRIVDQALVLPVALTDKPLQAALQPLDRDGDRSISPDDFMEPGRPREEAEALFQLNVANALRKAGVIKNLNQWNGVRALLATYNTVMEFDRFTTRLFQKRINQGGSNLTLTDSDWKHDVEPYIYDYPTPGLFTPTRLGQLAYDVYATVAGCAGRPPQPRDPFIATSSPSREMRWIYNQTCGLLFNTEQVPTLLRTAVTQVAERYERSAHYLFQYDRMGSQRLSGYGFDLTNISRLLWITPGQWTHDATAKWVEGKAPICAKE